MVLCQQLPGSTAESQLTSTARSARYQAGNPRKREAGHDSEPWVCWC